MTGNIADSNGIKNIHVVDAASNTLISGLPQEGYSAQKLFFEGFILSFIAIIISVLTVARRVKED